MTDGQDHHARRVRDAYRNYDTTQAEQNKRDVSNAGNAAIARERRTRLLDSIQAAFSGEIAAVRVLDIGCGRGDLLGWLLDRGARAADLHGIDLLDDRIAKARREFPTLDLRVADARQLPFDSATLDLIICSTMFSSVIEPEVAQAVAAEIRRTLAPAGVVLWYDVRLPNPGNPNTIAMTKQQIKLLFPDFRLELRSTTLLPPLARRLGRFTATLYPVLAALPPLRSHYLGLLRHA